MTVMGQRFPPVVAPSPASEMLSACEPAQGRRRYRCGCGGLGGEAQNGSEHPFRIPPGDGFAGSGGSRPSRHYLQLRSVVNEMSIGV